MPQKNHSRGEPDRLDCIRTLKFLFRYEISNFRRLVRVYWSSNQVLVYLTVAIIKVFYINRQHSWEIYINSIIKNNYLCIVS